MHFQCGTTMEGKTQYWKWPRKTTSTAILPTPLHCTRMATPRLSLTNPGHSTSLVEPRVTARRVRSWSWLCCLQGTATLVFLRLLLQWSSMVPLLLQLALLQASEVVSWWLWDFFSGDYFDVTNNIICLFFFLIHFLIFFSLKGWIYFIHYNMCELQHIIICNPILN